MENRVTFCMDHTATDQEMFSSMMDVIHTDEKCFFITKNTRKYYRKADEKEPHRPTKSKRLSIEVMFLAAAACPRWATGRNQLFNGKIRVWPFTKTEGAKRSSQNRTAGTPEMKSIPSVTNVEYRQFLLQQVLPSVDERWPHCHRAMTVRIQQDNARLHITPSDPEFVEAVSHMDVKIKLVS